MPSDTAKLPGPVSAAVGGTATDPYPPYAWPGGYEIGYVMADGELVCAQCVATEDQAGEAGVTDPDCPDDDQWRIVGWVTSETVNAGERDGAIECCAHCDRIWPDTDDPDA